MRKFKKRWLLILVFISILSTSAFNRRYKDVRADEADTTEVTPNKKPSGDATKFLGIWLTSGYTLQPTTNTYIEVNQTKSLYANAGRSALVQLTTALYINKKYQWYQSTDGKNWSKVPSKDSGTNKTLSITPTTVGTTYYQLDTYWQTAITGLTASHLYSNVATVHAVPEPVNATSVEVETDDDYLYNSSNDLINIETYAHAIPTPANFTGTVTWSVDRTDLATIDEESGLLTANTSRLSGPVTVTATLHNPDGSKTYGEKVVTVGGGLENQTVNAGQTATFDLRGNVGDLDEDDDTNYTVKWYKEDPITHSRTQIQKDKPQALSYTTPETTLDDDGTLFLAILQVNYGGKTYSYTTNDAFLYVRPEGGPEISLSNTMTNETYNDGTNTDNMLFGVNNGDTITYKDTVTNNSTGGTLSNATYTLPLRNKTTVSSVKVDGKEIDSANYQLKDNDTTGATDLMISGLNFKISESHTIEVETKVSDIDKQTTFSSIPYITGTNDEDDSQYQKIGNQNVINYTLDTVTITNANDIDYGTMNSITSKGTISRQSELNLPNNVIDIEDTRRSKTPVTLSVMQESELTNENSAVLSGHLRYYDNGKFQDLLNKPTIISETNDNEALNSLGWDKDNGILLYMDSKFNQAGTYTTRLNWTIQDSV